MVTNVKLAFRHNSTCVVIKKWLEFKRVITVRLDYFLKIYANGSKKI